MDKSGILSLLARALLVLTVVAAPWSLSSDFKVAALEDMNLIGEARMEVLFWDVYDARLYAPSNSWSPEQPFALVLTYLLDLKGERIAERSIQEIRKQGFDDELTLARWYEMLAGIIPDVGDGDEIVGVSDSLGHTRFYLNGELIGEIREPEFTDRFFGIWLSELTSDPELRRNLLGGNV
jgi:hypothetical protein